MTITSKTTTPKAATQTESESVILNDFGLSNLAELVDDWVIYRSLEPLDNRVQGLKRARFQMGIHATDIPRKLDRDYAKAAIWFLDQIHAVLRRPDQIRELLFVGDTLSGDGQAFRNIISRSGWRGSCLIVDEQADVAPRIDLSNVDDVVVANRWSHAGEWLSALRSQGFKLDHTTAVVLDLDKTAIGARGRNDKAIDKARLSGIFHTMHSVLGDNFDQIAFENDYNILNQPRFHVLTGDNQDYLGYICMVINGCVATLDEVIGEVETNSLRSFEHFIRWIEVRIKNGSCANEDLRQAHEAVLTSVQNGDPTPFKRFRREEFLATLAHMNNLPDDLPMTQRMAEEITITQEVREAALWLKKQGCLVISMSDKPDEASCPDKRFSADKPHIHRALTHCVGVSIQPILDQIG